MTQLAVLLYRLGLHNPAVLLEFVSVAIVAALADLLSKRSTKTADPGRTRVPNRRRLFLRLSLIKRRSVLIAAALPLTIRAALLPIYPPPAPAIHDEFSTILVADTLTHGRIANPTHPFAEHFETFQVLQKPAYASFRPIGPALPLAISKIVTNSFWVGVWLSTGAMCGAICWMLQGWMPPLWAFTGAVLAGLQIGVLSYWMNSYWGGSVAAFAGAIAMGALGRLRRQPRLVFGVLLTASLMLLLLSRPFEGVMFSSGIAVVLLGRLVKNKRWRQPRAILRIALPALTGVLVLIGWTLYYNSRLTGDARVFPYELGVQKYNFAPSFVWGDLDLNKKHDSPWRRSFHERSELHMYRLRESLGRAPLFVSNLAHMWQFFVRPALTIPLIAGLATVAALPAMRALALPAIFTIAAMPLATWYNVHYIAAITGIVYGLVAQGMRLVWLYRDRSRQAVGRNFVLAIVCACVITLTLSIVLEVRGTPFGDGLEGWAGNHSQMLQREAMARELRAQPGQDLVFVRYAPGHDFEREWVQNDADLDGADVIWARELDAERNEALTRYFGERKMWLVEPDNPQVRLTRYLPNPAMAAASPTR